MKTFYGLLLIMCAFVMSVVLLSPILMIGRMSLIFLILLLTWREIRTFPVQSVFFINNKILVTENGLVYEADYQASTVIARHLCFLHLQVSGGEKRWWIPVSRLEFSKESFRQLKYALQRFSMDAI